MSEGTTSSENMLHQFRKEIDKNIQFSESVLKEKPTFGREMALVHTKLQEAKMWCGKCLEVSGAEFPKELQDKAE